MEPQSLFSYNLPSIPGKSIRLRMQSIPKSGFSSKIPRQTQNYSKLNDSFTSQYSNLKLKRAQSVSNQTDTSTKASTVRKQQPQCWYIIPQHKGILINLYEELNKEPQKQVENPNAILRKRDNISRKLYAKFIKEKNQQKSMYQQILKDEYHKAWEEQVKKKEMRKVKESPCFLTIPRTKQPKQNNTRIQQQQQYQVGHNILLLQDCERLEQQLQQSKYYPLEQQSQFLQMKNLKQKTQKMLFKLNYKPKQARIDPPQLQEQDQIPHHMFIKDDRDRFGAQIFPIVAKLNNPGPGSYNEKNTMQSKAKKVKLLEEQRKILKQWFND